ncbi:MAG TPA: hypothetical protein VIK01_03955 [Polyangiaceae bacterium]
MLIGLALRDAWVAVIENQGILIVNAGSVGAPFKEFVDHKPPTLMPYAEYATVEAEAGGVQVTLRRVAVDKRAMWQAAVASSNPLAPMMATPAARLRDRSAR